MIMLKEVLMLMMMMNVLLNAKPSPGIGRLGQRTSDPSSGLFFIFFFLLLLLY